MKTHTIRIFLKKFIYKDLSRFLTMMSLQRLKPLGRVYTPIKLTDTDECISITESILETANAYTDAHLLSKQ